MQTGHTALQRAAAGGHLDIARLLVTQGASLDHQDELVIRTDGDFMQLAMIVMIRLKCLDFFGSFWCLGLIRPLSGCLLLTILVPREVIKIHEPQQHQSALVNNTQLYSGGALAVIMN